jgi:hypothetical protein
MRTMTSPSWRSLPLAPENDQYEGILNNIKECLQVRNDVKLTDYDKNVPIKMDRKYQI